MTSTPFKGVLAGLAAVAIAGAALAQSTPPNPASKDAATGAGQQSTQTTPMGSTGTPNTSSAPAAASDSSSGTPSTAAGSSGSAPSTAAGSGSTDTSTSGSTMGASGTTTTTTTDTTTTETKVASKKRGMRADRN